MFMLFGCGQTGKLVLPSEQSAQPTQAEIEAEIEKAKQEHGYE